MHSLTPAYLAALCFDGVQSATLRSLGEYQGKQELCATPPPQALKGLRQIAVVESTESSNRREGWGVAPSRLKSLVTRYYQTLEAGSQGWHQGQHDDKPWLDYFRGTLLRAYREFEERVGTVERARGSKGERMRAKALARSQPFSISVIEQGCPGVSRDMVRLVLRAMKAEG